MPRSYISKNRLFFNLVCNLSFFLISCLLIRLDTWWYHPPPLPLRCQKEQMSLTVNGIWRGVTSPPLIVKKSCNKQQNQSTYIFASVIKSSLAIFETLSALGACYVTIIGRMVDKKSTIYKSRFLLSYDDFWYFSSCLFWHKHSSLAKFFLVVRSSLHSFCFFRNRTNFLTIFDGDLVSLFEV